jgi:hypothetical protein
LCDCRNIRGRYDRLCCRPVQSRQFGRPRNPLPRGKQQDPRQQLGANDSTRGTAWDAACGTVCTDESRCRVRGATKLQRQRRSQQRQFQQQAELAKALRQIRQQQSLLRAQTSAMRSLKAEVREARETLRKVKVQVAAGRPTVVAEK